MVISDGRLLQIATELDGALGDLQAAADVTGIQTNFSSNKFEALTFKERTALLPKTRLQNLNDLCARVGLVGEAVGADARADFCLKTLRQVHRVCDRNEQQVAVRVTRPVKQVVQQRLLVRHQRVQLVNQHHHPHLVRPSAHQLPQFVRFED
jgi:hypothetical protein